MIGKRSAICLLFLYKDDAPEGEQPGSRRRFVAVARATKRAALGRSSALRPRLDRHFGRRQTAIRPGLAKGARVVYAKPMADLAESARLSATSPTRRKIAARPQSCRVFALRGNIVLAVELVRAKKASHFGLQRS
jgi:hypothetical protein